MNKKAKIILATLTAFSLVAFVIPSFIQADDNNGVFTLDIKPPTKWHSLMELLNYVVGILIWLAFASLTLAILYAGFLFLSSGGNPTKIKKAKNALVLTLVGLFIILFSKLIIAIIRGVFSGKI